MSDGPLYSPEMNKPTRQLAEACGNSASSASERAELMEEVALHAHRKEGGDKAVELIDEALSAAEGDLFGDNRAEILENLRNEAPQTAFCQSLFDNVIEAIHDGTASTNVLELGLANAYACRIDSEARAIVGHGLSSDDVSNARAMRAGVNLNEASMRFNARALAKDTIENGVRRKTSRSAKRKSLDEGPSL